MQNWLDQHHNALWFIIPCYVAVLYLLVATVVSYVGGWTTLAKQFRFRAAFFGEEWSGQSGQMRWMLGYRACLTLGCDQDGLYLAIMPLFRFRHPALRIPWNEIKVSKTKILFASYVRLGLGRELDIPLYLRVALADELKQAAGNHWPTEQVA